MDLSGNPWVLYPGDTTGDTEGVVIRENPVFIDSIVWSNYGSADHVCDLKDAKDREVFFRLGSSDLSPVELCPGSVPIKGLKLFSLDSGQLQIFVR